MPVTGTVDTVFLLCHITSVKRGFIDEEMGSER